MSAPEPAPAAAASGAEKHHETHRAELDVAKLHSLPSEQQDLYLLTFTSDLVQYVSGLTKEEISSEQVFVKQELFMVLNLKSPTITRVIRNNLGKCFGAILGRGDRIPLYDTVLELLALVNGGKGVELKTKLAAAHCLGEVFASAGDSAYSQTSAAVAGLFKLLKASSNHAGARGLVLAALRKVVGGLGGPIEEQVGRDIWKQARNVASTDKASLAQINACRCLEQLIKTTTYFDNQNDFDNLKTLIWKIIDSSTAPVRHAAASCLARALVKSYSPLAGTELSAKAKKQKRQSKKPPPRKADEDEDEPPEPESPVSKKAESRLSLSLPDVLSQLSSQYVRSSTTNRARTGIAVCYKYVIRNLGESVVEERYSQIATHLLLALLNHPTVTYSRYRLLMTRKFVRIILEDTIGREILRETSQLNAANWLINGILKDYPQVIQERREPSKHTLTSALSALSSLISSLGSAVNSLGDACRETLIQVLPHPSYTVQIQTAQCLRNFVLACPSQLISCVTICSNSLNREIGQLATPRSSSRRCLGLANGLSAMLGTSRLQPLYGSVDVFARVLSQATDLLKNSGSSELRVASTQIQVAWILIGGLMPLGPSFVKIHLSQLMLLWKNALPKPLGKANTAERGTLETSFLAHVRECALGSMLSFLEFNGKLITVDGARRIGAMLQNTVSFLDDVTLPKTGEDISQRLFPSLQLHDFVVMVRRRVLQCFTKLVKLNHAGQSEIMSQSSLLSLAISSFADPDITLASPTETSIAASAGQFESLWELWDNFGFGVTGLARDYVNKTLSGRRVGRDSPWITVDSKDQEIDDILNFPICQASEYDSVLLYSKQDGQSAFYTDPPVTGVVNTAIELFAVALPLQPPKVQESSVEQIATLLSSNSLQRNLGRKAAMSINIAVALLHTLRVSVKETTSLHGNLDSSTEKIIQELLQKFIMEPDAIVRTIGFEALGRLCNSAGNAFTNAQIKWLVDTIVENREPNARAGCAAALGCIHSQVGGMAAGFHLKTIVGVLMSLCNDPHPVVHFWALDGLERVAESAGLTFSAYTSSTLGMLAQLYIADSHNEEAASLATSNIEVIFPTTFIIARAVDSLINVLGPDLQDIAKTRNLILTLVRQFQIEESPAMTTQSSRCLDHLTLYAPSHVDFGAYVKRLQVEISSKNPSMREAAFRGLSNLMKRDAESVINTPESTLEDDVWLAFDDSPDSISLRSLVRNWLQQTGLSHTELWIQRFHNVLTKTRAKVDDTPKKPVRIATASELPDDEVAGFASAVAGEQEDADNSASAGQELLKWQTRNFALSCLSELLSMVNDKILPDQTIPAEAALQQNIGDIVRMAFSASTANVIELRVWGLKILDQILKMFGKTPDPDFSEASLLEQYQAQIGSALTPAFATDSSPDLASEAINVCGTFVATGIVTNVDRMGRIFRLLVVGLENFAKNLDVTEIGDLKGLNSNARVMVKMALFSAWARLQMASLEQPYLVEIVKPYTAMLTPLWLSSLQEFARLRFEPDISGSLGTPSSGNLDEVYAALNRETLLNYYQESWLNLVDAIASLVEKDSDFVFDALDDKSNLQDQDEEQKAETNGEVSQGKGDNINYRDEPVAFFFVLFGLAFEALVDQSVSPLQRLGILQALKKILRPTVSGNAIYQDAVFSETIDTLDRLVLTEGYNIQTVIVETARNLSLDHPAAISGLDRIENLSDDIEQLFELTRNIILVLAGLLPNLSEASSRTFNVSSDESLTLIRLALSSLVDVAAVFPVIIRHDLHACILHIFSTILATGICQAEVVPHALPIFRRFVQGISPRDAPLTDTVSLQMRGCLTRFLTTLTIAQRRESESSLPCAKNTLLAMTIILTTNSHVIPPQDPLVSKVLDEFLDCLQDVGLASVAAGCIRSVLLNPGPRSATDAVIARYLFPRLIAFIAGVPDDRGEPPIDPENSRTAIAHTLVLFIGNNAAVPRSQLPVAVPLVVSALLARAKRDGSSAYQEIAVRFLEIGKLDSATFRAVVAGMEAEQKNLVEEILRCIETGSANKDLESEADGRRPAPTIALRMDF
ncbi:armadillo-type protein [Talaromyces proteolyticus]|uniref:Armadillo-type protein n=1 Tax=Talaromyces proteolyticus TaxID=1131652 RepID=A0AAD4PYX4_9EURO|nr:armadillo-type protein [Talaromyces proteolyticus]KAH8695099.1 armadillo-type protein [Talaromyces proteolyticus]